MHCASCPWTLSTKRFTYFCGFGTSFWPSSPESVWWLELVIFSYPILEQGTYKQNIVKWRQYMTTHEFEHISYQSNVIWYHVTRKSYFCSRYLRTYVYKYNYFQSYWIRKYGTSRQRSWSQTYSKHGGKISLFWLVDFVLLSSGKAISNIFKNLEITYIL